ncbi:hypothetical protein KUCAC02_032838 [Chaenocephalus aceratus]|nr:hypothetical protein KUCAC02_032838 [Chaenocephalus aceratus]
MAAVQWRSSGRSYDAELQRCRPEFSPVEFGDYHPLKAITDLGKKKKEEEAVGADFEPWSLKRGEILARFTTTEKLSINLFMGSDRGKAPSPGPSAVSEKPDYARIEAEPVPEGGVVLRSEGQSSEIVIQCSKLLSDTSVIQFYPSKFVLITDILDTFGDRLVFDRIWTMCSDPRTLPESFTVDDVNDTAKETCLNWFFKIASIRELLPRLYVEAAILKCNRFLNKSGIQETLPRLTAMIRGIGDPLVAAYARAYLCRVGMEVAPQLKDSLNRNFFDLLGSFRQISSESVQNQLVLQRVEVPEYLTLYSPAINWILQCIAYRAPEPLLMEMMERCKKLGNNALLLNSVMRAFRAEFVAARATDFIGMIKDCDEAGFPKHLLFGSLGRSVACADPPESERLTILNEAWKVVTKVRSPQDYIDCAEIWVEFTCRYFAKREVNTVLADIIKHMTPDRAFEDAYPQLQSVIRKILTYFQDFSVLFSMERFLPFLDMFPEGQCEGGGVQIHHGGLHQNQVDPTRDPVILNAMLHICKTMARLSFISPLSVCSALTLEDEKRSLSLLIVGFVRMVSFGRDFEQQLSFCVEARASFCNLESVLVQLIHTVNTLAMETSSVMRGNHSRKTAAFVRACAAYSFITVPSLSSIFSRLSLYLLSGQVALANQCLSQAVSLLPDVPRSISVEGKLRSSESFLLDFINNFLSTLLVVPDHPEHGVLYLVRGLLNMVQDYSWEESSDAKVRVYISALPLLAAMSQESYLYSIPKGELSPCLWYNLYSIPRVDSNETLYGGDPKFLSEINKLCETLIGQILDQLKTLGRDESQQADMSHLSETVQRLALQTRT